MIIKTRKLVKNKMSKKSDYDPDFEILEELQELDEAIKSGDEQRIMDELGDVLFHAEGMLVKRLCDMKYIDKLNTIKTIKRFPEELLWL